MFHNGDLLQNINQNGIYIYSISTTERVLRYGENNRVAFFEHPTTVEGKKERIIKIYAETPAEDVEAPADEAVEDTAADAVVEVAEQPVEVVSEDDEEEPVIEETPPEKPKILPLYEKYQHYQQEFPNTVVAMRVGDFFEIFGEAAVTVAKELSMTLTSRDCGLSERVPMIGYPFHVADTYREKIRAFANITVIDGEQMNFYPKIEPVQPEPVAVLPDNYAIIEETGEIVELPAAEKPKEPQGEDPYADMDLMYKIYMLLDQKIDIVK